MNHYPALRTISSALRYIAVIVAVIGIGGSVLYLLQGSESQWSTMIVTAGIVGSVIFGILLYALGDSFRCILDIEEHTRPVEVNAKTNGVKAKANGGNGTSSAAIKATRKIKVPAGVATRTGRERTSIAE